MGHKYLEESSITIEHNGVTLEFRRPRCACHRYDYVTAVLKSGDTHYAFDAFPNTGGNKLPVLERMLFILADKMLQENEPK